MEILNSYQDFEGKWHYCVTLDGEYGLPLSFDTEQTETQIYEYIKEHHYEYIKKED